MLIVMHELHVLRKAACIIPHRLRARLGKDRHSELFVQLLRLSLQESTRWMTANGSAF